MQLQEMKDITSPEHGVQVQIRRDGKVIWVHVDGVTVLRVCQVQALEIVDERGEEGMKKQDNLYLHGQLAKLRRRIVELEEAGS